VTIYLIRHAQSKFNAVFDLNRSKDPMIFDAPITELGERQALDVRDQVAQLGIKRIIVSPFTRALQTACLIFGETRPFEVHPEVREQVVHSCDVGRPPHELAGDFSHLEFSHLENHWWYKGENDQNGIPVEPDEVLKQRADAYATTLKSAPSRPTAIVSHGNFIRALSGIKPGNCEIIEYDPKK